MGNLGNMKWEREKVVNMVVGVIVVWWDRGDGDMVRVGGSVKG